MLDVDGVLVVRPEGRRWDWNLEVDLGLASSLLEEEFFQVHFQEVVLGQADLRERLGSVLARIAPHLSAETLIAYWFEHDSFLDDVLLKDLSLVRRAGLRLHLATVQEHYRARHLWDALKLSEHFDGMHYAADLGCAKPDPEFFARVGSHPKYF